MKRGRLIDGVGEARVPDNTEGKEREASRLREASGSISLGKRIMNPPVSLGVLVGELFDMLWLDRSFVAEYQEESGKQC